MRCDWHIVWVGLRPPFDLEHCVVRRFAFERNVCRQSRRYDAGYIPSPFKHFISKCCAAAIFRIFRNRQHHFHGEEIVGIESERNVLQSLKALHHQASANQKRECDRNLNHDQSLQPPAASSIAATAVIALLHPRHQLICARAFQRRQQAKSDSGENSDAQCECQNALVDREIVEKRCKRNALNRIKRGKDRKKPIREKETSYPTEQRQENVLRKELPGNTPTSGAKCTSQKEFSFARYSAGQLQVGDIRATNQQEECDTSH